VHPEEAVSSASLASALGATTWAERARLDGLLRAAAEAGGYSQRGDPAAPAVSLVDSARLTGRLDANIQELAEELRNLRELLDGGGKTTLTDSCSGPDGGSLLWSAGGGPPALAKGETQSATLFSVEAAPALKEAFPLEFSKGGATVAASVGTEARPPAAEASTGKPPSPESPPPKLPGVLPPPALPGVPEEQEPVSPSLIADVRANPESTAYDLKVCVARVQGLAPERQQLLVRGQSVPDEQPLRELLADGEDPEDLELALVPLPAQQDPQELEGTLGLLPREEEPEQAPVPADPPMPASVAGEEEPQQAFVPMNPPTPTVSSREELEQAGKPERALVPADAPRKADEMVPPLVALAGNAREPYMELSAELVERFEEMGRREARRCTQLEDWVGRLMQAIDCLEQRRGQAAEERLLRLESLERSLDDLDVRIRPALGGPDPA